jgi:hypothetical protein
MTEPYYYSMIKLVEDDWPDGKKENVLIVVKKISDQFVEITAVKNRLCLTKTYSSKMFGEVCDAFMWLASYDMVSYDRLIKFGFVQSTV